jgi:hypothetical protein
MLKVVCKQPVTIGPLFRDAIENKVLPVWIFLPFLPQMMHVINNETLVPYFSRLMLQLAEQ